MPSCLGIYIQNNLIKYAKISKDHNNLKVEAYGVKFYDTDIEKTIEQIIKETYSYQIPISVNIGKENYTYANVFNLLKQQDLEKAINTEFEFFCSNNNKNKNTLEYRRIKTVNLDDRDKTRIIYTYIDKASIVERLQLLDKYKTQNISPIATVIPNLNKTLMQENSIIVNLEENTEITTVVNGTVYQVDKIEQGIGTIIRSIAERENSMAKAYEICKNTTVYTKSGQNLKLEGNEYLDEIITALFEIIEKVRGTIIVNGLEINNIYISGMGLVINNIDLLFQENFIDKKCEILVPYFVEKTNVKVNIKDYIEVNSAIALALQGLETKNQDANFSDKGNNLQKLWTMLNSDVGRGSKIKVKSNKPKLTIKEIANLELDFTDKILLRTVATFLLIIILYISATEILSKQINQKIRRTEQVITASNEEITKIQKYKTLIDTRTTEYQTLIDRIDESNSQLSENYSSKNAIPNLLNKIMYNIPKGVQLLSIENQTGKDIVITAQAEEYDQLGYFKAVLQEEGILTNVTTTKGVNQNGIIGITITGQLAY